jgi:hypothetical protein
MADPLTPAQPGADAPAKPEIPSFSKVAAESAASHTAAVRELAGIEALEPKTESRVETAPASTPAANDAGDCDFDATWGKLGERERTGIAERFYGQYNHEIATRYGDILPLVVEAQQNPQLRAALVQLATKAELREMITDPRLQQYADQLTKKELRDFIFGEAIPTYERYAPAQVEPVKVADPNAERLSALEQRFELEASERADNAFVAARQREGQAFLTDYPQLATDQKLLEHIVTVTEDRFERAALRAGVDTKKPGWTLRAEKAGVKKPSYVETYKQFEEVSGRAKPPAAPGTSPAVLPAAQVQAPRSKAEGKAAALKVLQGGGGFENLSSKFANRGKG